MAESQSSGSDTEDWEETGLESSPCLCLFCISKFDGGSSAVLDHCSQEHGFDLFKFAQKLELDYYSCIKLINYIRKEHPDPSIVLEAVEPYPWLPEHYLIPVIEDDPLLQLDFEPDEQSSNDGEISLEKKLAAAEQSSKKYQDALTQALKDLESMRCAVQDLVGEGSSNDPTTSPPVDEDKWCDEEGYFSSYTHFNIHEEMLKDEVRTETYKFFIEKNPHVFENQVVLDIGCGTGILSLFAASAGAKHVIAVDQSNVIYKAMDIIRENGYEDRVTIIKGKVEEVDLPVDKVDVIVSEWMGYFLLYESMLDTVLFARDKWLKDPRNLFPSSCSLTIVAMGNRFEWESRVQFWESVYGFKMNCMKESVLREPAIQVVDGHSTISSDDTIKKFDLCTVTQEELDFEAPFSLTMTSDTKCHAIVGYFDVGFDGVDFPLYMSTSPQDPPTHWKQTVFYLQEPIAVHTGDLLKGKLSCHKNKKNPRALDVVIECELLSFIPDAKCVKVKQKYSLE